LAAFPNEPRVIQFTARIVFGIGLSMVGLTHGYRLQWPVSARDPLLALNPPLATEEK
jgi:hypothetical protein